MIRRLVDDERLPDGVRWMNVRCEDGKRYLFVRRSLCKGNCGACDVLAELENSARTLEG